MFIRLTDKIAVAPQISPEDVARAKAEGFTFIINNRPDDEGPGQPAGAEIAAAAAAAGLGYAAIPVDHTGLTVEKAMAMAEALKAAPGPVLAFCRSGTRSTNLWALAEAMTGGDPDVLVGAAANGGYDISGLLPALQKLSRG
jgi:uncharacterized protein (TIGR01244 family)